MPCQRQRLKPLEPNRGMLPWPLWHWVQTRGDLITSTALSAAPSSSAPFHLSRCSFISAPQGNTCVSFLCTLLFYSLYILNPPPLFTSPLRARCAISDALCCIRDAAEEAERVNSHEGIEPTAPWQQLGGREGGMIGRISRKPPWQKESDSKWALQWSVLNHSEAKQQGSTSIEWLIGELWARTPVCACSPFNAMLVTLGKYLQVMYSKRLSPPAALKWIQIGLICRKGKSHRVLRENVHYIVIWVEDNTFKLHVSSHLWLLTGK